jgi:predicted MFS family arabinose efflux permease
MSIKLLAEKQGADSYRWVMLVLCALTPLFVYTLPNMSLPPLFSTISQELNLTLVQVGVIWGAPSFIGIFFALIGGTLSDRLGTRLTLFATCLLTGIFGMTRIFSGDFISLLITTTLMGTFQAVIPVAVYKTARDWFHESQLGMASGVISAGFAAGLTLGPLLSTTVLVPLLGGWKQLLIFYGLLGILIGVLWWILCPPRKQAEHTPHISLLSSLRHVMQIRNTWVLGLAGMGISGAFNGFTGYLPTYLKTIGWAELDADRALAAFFFASFIAVIPLSILSDRLRLRRGFLIVSALMLALGIGSISVIEGVLLLVVIAIAGSVFDAFMAILNASVMEIDGIGLVYAGTAVGFSTMIRNLGGTFSPPVGNSLTAIGANVPFLFWGAMGLFAVAMFIFAYQPTRKSS